MALQVVDVFPFDVVYHVSHGVHVLALQLYLNHALHVNPHDVSDVQRLVQLYILSIASQFWHVVRLFLSVEYFQAAHSSHLFQLTTYHAFALVILYLVPMFGHDHAHCTAHESA